MAKKKLTEPQRKKLMTILARKLRKNKDASLSSVLRDVAGRFGVTAEAVRYYLARHGLGPGAGSHSLAAVRALLAEAEKHRKIARETSRRHLKLADKYERAARQIQMLAR